jgi:predicted hydrolase (HD superfamily)
MLFVIMERQRLLELLRKYLKTENTVKHLIATEAVMRAIARRLEPEKKEYGD